MHSLSWSVGSRGSLTTRLTAVWQVRLIGSRTSTAKRTRLGHGQEVTRLAARRATMAGCLRLRESQLGRFVYFEDINDYRSVQQAGIGLVGSLGIIGVPEDPDMVEIRARCRRGCGNARNFNRCTSRPVLRAGPSASERRERLPPASRTTDPGRHNLRCRQCRSTRPADSRWPQEPSWKMASSGFTAAT